MNKKNTGNLAAVIEIGAGAVRMRISQMRRGKIDVLDSLEYPVHLGHEVYTEGRIRFESLRQLSGILSKFTAALETYGCTNVRLVSSTLMREAENRSFVADQIKIHNHLHLEILEYSEEKALISSEILRLLQNEPKVDMDNALLALIGTGSISVIHYDGAAIRTAQNIPVGSVKLHDTLQSVSRESDDFYPVVEDYLDLILNRIEIPSTGIRSLILNGSDLPLVASVCGAEKSGDLYTIPAKKLRSAYKELRTMSHSAAARRFNITEEQAAVLFTALSIYNGMLRLSKDTQKIICPDIDICDALTRHMLVPGAQKEYRAQTHENALASARRIAEKYNCHGIHGETVAGLACELFDKLKNVHGLSPEKKIILELSAILHSCGQYINMRIHNQCAFDLIKNLDIFGMTHDQIMEVAYVSGFDELNAPNTYESGFRLLPEDKQLEISKLVAIFRMANALDKSKHQKLEIQKIRTVNDKLEIKAVATNHALLEKWAFEECADFFREVFGLSAELHIRSNLL